MKSKTLVLFAHGKESGPRGEKILRLAEVAHRLGAQVDSPDYSDLKNPDERVSRLLNLPLPPYDQLILVGSSMGGYVSTVASKTLLPDGLFLLAPAFYMPGYAVSEPRSHSAKTAVVFGWNDEVIPVDHGIRFARDHRCQLHILDADHRLNGVIDEVEILFENFLRQTTSNTAIGIDKDAAVLENR